MARSLAPRPPKNQKRGEKTNKNRSLCSTEILNPATMTWSTGPDMAVARSQAGLVMLALGGRVLVVGGFDSRSHPTHHSSTEVLSADPAGWTLRWTAGPELSQPRSGACVAAIVGSKVLVAGGRLDVLSNAGSVLSSTEIIDLDESMSTGESAMMQISRRRALSATPRGENQGDEMLYPLGRLPAGERSAPPPPPPPQPQPKEGPAGAPLGGVFALHQHRREALKARSSMVQAGAPADRLAQSLVISDDGAVSAPSTGDPLCAAPSNTLSSPRQYNRGTGFVRQYNRGTGFVPAAPTSPSRRDPMPSSARGETAVVADLCAFLAEQPDKALRGVKMASFYQAYPNHKGKGLKLKALATAHPDRLRWVPGATPAAHRCCLAGTHLEEAATDLSSAPTAFGSSANGLMAVPALHLTYLGQPIGAPSASSAHPAGGGRGRAGPRGTRGQGRVRGAPEAPCQRGGGHGHRDPNGAVARGFGPAEMDLTRGGRGCGSDRPSLPQARLGQPAAAPSAIRFGLGRNATDTQSIQPSASLLQPVPPRPGPTPFAAPAAGPAGTLNNSDDELYDPSVAWLQPASVARAPPPPPQPPPQPSESKEESLFTAMGTVGNDTVMHGSSMYDSSMASSGPGLADAPSVLPPVLAPVPNTSSMTQSETATALRDWLTTAEATKGAHERASDEACSRSHGACYTVVAAAEHRHAAAVFNADGILAAKVHALQCARDAAVVELSKALDGERSAAEATRDRELDACRTHAALVLSELQPQITQVQMLVTAAERRREEIDRLRLQMQELGRQADMLEGAPAPAPTPAAAECGICMDRPKNHAFQCGHQACGECAFAVTECHMCRVPITLRIKLWD